MLSPIMDELASELNTCAFYKIDIDNSEKTASKHNIMSIPTLLISKVKEQITGFKTKKELLELIEK